MAGLLVMAEVAIAAVLLVACSLLFRTLYNLEHKYLGFDVENVVTFRATPPTSSGYLNSSEGSGSRNSAIASHVYLPILEELRKLPGVSEAALTSSIPFDGVDMNTSFTLNGHTRLTREEQQSQHAQIRVMSGEYMKTMETPMIRGRPISDHDIQERPYVAVVNQAFAREFFRKVDPVGQQIGIGGKETGMENPYTVVGVVADAAQKSTSRPAIPELILSYRQIPEKSFFYPILISAAMNYVLRSRGREDLGGEIHGLFRRMAPGFAIDDLQTMQKTVDAANFNQRLGFYLIGSFAGVAIVMVMVGLYGVLSQLVSRRRQEIGVRMALGATSQSILALIVRQGLVLIVAGLAAGMLMASMASRLIASFLYGVRPMDAWSYAGAAVALAVIGLMAALVPASRAAAIEPMEALRAE
jgi:predicted permease